MGNITRGLAGALAALALAAGLAGCGADENAGKAFLGYWACTSIDGRAEGDEVPEDVEQSTIEQFWHMGLEVSLEFAEGGKLTMTTLGNAQEGTWVPTGGSSAAIALPGAESDVSSTVLHVRDGKITMSGTEDELVFERAEKPSEDSGDEVDGAEDGTESDDGGEGKDAPGEAGDEAPDAAEAGEDGAAAAEGEAGAETGASEAATTEDGSKE